MSKENYQNRYRIPSVRAAWHDYSDGMYFVTICTKDRKHYFGEITNCENRQQITLSPIGKFADEQFQNAQNHYPYAEIPLWIVMPNHIHSIITIDHNKIPYERRNIAGAKGYENISGARCDEISAEARCNEIYVEPRCTTALQNMHNGDISYQRQIANMQGWLSVVVGGLKRSVTHFANQCLIPFAWQTRFYDHIIRNKKEMNHIAKYIENNIANWEQDMFYGVLE